MAAFPISKANRWAFIYEVLVLAKKFGYRFKKIPLSHSARGIGLRNWRDYLMTLWEVIKIRYRLWRRLYSRIA
jgi:hypothetical protein